MIRFSKYIWLYFLISAFILVPGIFSLAAWRLKPAVDFTGGTLVELRFDQPISQDKLEERAAAVGLSLVSLQQSDKTTYILRMKEENAAKLDLLKDNLSRESSISAAVVRNETVGPILGKELLTKALAAAVIAIIAILAYVAYAFKNIKFGVSAVIALFHDLLVILGSFSLLGKFAGVEVDTLYVTAFLTTMSFSVHDTIVVFDRIREYLRTDSRRTFEEICDRALTETMNRSLANSMTIIIMLAALVLLGGVTTKWFSVALLVGTISGTYSSPFVATPILILWHRWEERRRH